MVRRIRLSVVFPVESTIFLASESPLGGVGAAMSTDRGAGWMLDAESAWKAPYGGVAAADSVGNGAAGVGVIAHARKWGRQVHERLHRFDCLRALYGDHRGLVRYVDN